MGHGFLTFLPLIYTYMSATLAMRRPILRMPRRAQKPPMTRTQLQAKLTYLHRRRREIGRDLGQAVDCVAGNLNGERTAVRHKDFAVGKRSWTGRDYSGQATDSVLKRVAGFVVSACLLFVPQIINAVAAVYDSARLAVNEAKILLTNRKLRKLEPQVETN